MYINTMCNRLSYPNRLGPRAIHMYYKNTNEGAWSSISSCLDMLLLDFGCSVN